MADAPARFVTLGASNLHRDLPALVATLAARAGTVELLAACGNGRAYGGASRYAGVRALPSILECGVWAALATGSAPVGGLITDLGNDLLYGARARDVVHGLDTCLARFQDVGVGHTVVVVPPLPVVAALPPWRYRLAKALLFPGRRLSHDALLQRLTTIVEAIHTLGTRPAVTVLNQDPAWYGLDPIHPQAAGRAVLRERLLDAWGYPPPVGDAAAVARQQATGLEARLRWRPLVAAETIVAGRRRHQAQPVFDHPGQATVACY